MKFGVRLYNRDFSYPLVIPQVNMEVTSYSWNYRGGPETANITCWGQNQELWEMLEWVRAPVEITDWRGDTVWWGYINKAEVRVGSLGLGVDLENMNNRVATAYVRPGADDRATTCWKEDPDSINTYGYKEMLLSLGTGGSAQAEGLRDTQLEERKWPTPTVEHNPDQSELSVNLECLGWYETLKWRYYTNLAGEESYKIEGLGTQYIGEVASSMEARQSFMLQDGVDPWVANAAWVKMRKANNPATPAYVIITSSTGNKLTGGSLPASDIGPNHAWIEYTLDASILISPSTSYYIKVSGASTACPTDYYVVNVNEELSYPRGVFTIWNANTSAWISASPDADMEFKIIGVTETSQQITWCACRMGQFFSSIDMTLASSTFSSPYRNGDLLAYDVMDKLLDAGTSNKRKLQASVTRERVLKVWEEPAFSLPSASLFLKIDGRLWDKFDRVDHLCPVGDWLVLRDVFPGNLNLSKMMDAARLFIEKATYRVQDGTIRIEPRAGAERFAVVKDG